MSIFNFFDFDHHADLQDTVPIQDNNFNISDIDKLKAKMDRSFNKFQMKMNNLFDEFSSDIIWLCN